MRATHCFSAIALVVLCAAPAAATDKAHDILAQAKVAAGGAAIDAIRTTHSQLSVATGGLTGTASSIEDNLTGRFVDSFQLGPAKGANGFDGTTAWSQDASGQSRADDAEEARQVAANEAYRRTYSFFTARQPGKTEYVGARQDGAESFDVVRITPEGGRPFDLWIDSSSLLIARAVEQTGTQISTTYYTDYREVAGVRLAHNVRVNLGDPKYDTVVTIDSIAFNGAIDAAQFAMPAPPPPDFGFAQGGRAVTVPFEMINNHMYVDVKLNGQGPYRLLCDTGGANIVTPALATELGLKTEGRFEGRGVGEKSEDIGMTRMERLEIGDAYLRDQVFFVFPLGELGRVEGIAAHGLIGYEVFKRFIVRIDYERNRLTLTDPASFEYTGSGVRVPFKFKEHIPEVEGEIDGIAGTFDIDTGSRSTLDMMRPFVEKHGLMDKYRPKFEGVTGWGVGGPSRSAIARAGVLKLGGVTIERPIIELTLQSKGAFTDQYVAGNVGAALLKRFNLVFDYRNQMIFFERNANDTAPDAFDRSGMWLNAGEDLSDFEVVDVIAGGPAERAGIKVRDRVRSVDGVAADKLKLYELRQRFRTAAPGTRISIELQRAGKTSRVRLELRDLV
jgi:hypothetical protein